jgi:hypothetical protein
MNYKKESHPTGVSTFAITHECFYFFLVFVNFVSHKPTHKPKIAKELPPLPPEGKIIF